MRSVVLALALSLVLSGCSVIGSDAVPLGAGRPSLRASADEPIGEIDASAAREHINRYRRSRGLSELSFEPRLMAMAEEHARAMAKANKMSHSVGGSFNSRLARSGYDAGTAAENLGAGYFNAEDVVKGWQRSRGHNRNLLLADLRHMGIAAAHAPGTRHKVYWALVVGRPFEGRTAGPKPAEADSSFGSPRIGFRIPIPSLSNLIPW